MAELATIARPYAEALFKAAGDQAASFVASTDTLARIAADPDLRQLSDNPRIKPIQIFDLVGGIALSKGLQIDVKVGNLLRAVLDNGRLDALPEIAAQFKSLVNARSGTSEAVIHSAFPIDGTELAGVVAALEKRFGRKLDARVVLDPELIGGVRVVVGDEVLDTSVKARLEQMKVALTA